MISPGLKDRASFLSTELGIQAKVKSKADCFLWRSHLNRDEVQGASQANDFLCPAKGPT